MQGKFVIKPAKNGGYEIFLKTGNGKIRLTNVTFKAKAGVKNGIESAKSNSLQQGSYEYDVRSVGRA